MIVAAKLPRLPLGEIMRHWCSRFRRTTDIPCRGAIRLRLSNRATMITPSFFRRVVAPAVLLLAGSAAPAVAQSFELSGTRAQGMGGAFVAVADDALGHLVESGRPWWRRVPQCNCRAWADA